MEGMGLKFIPVIGRHLLCHLSMFGAMAGTFGTNASPNSPNGGFNLPLVSRPPLLFLPTHPPL